MAIQKRVKFGTMYLLLADPSVTPLEYTAPCGINTFGKNVTTNTNDVELRDCADPDLPVWLGVDVVSKRMTLNFSGNLDEGAYQDIWKKYFMSQVAWPLRVYEKIGEDTAKYGYWSGEGVLTNYDDTANGGGSYTVTGTIIIDGAPVWTASTTGG